jgi:hypothetical protein
MVGALPQAALGGAPEIRIPLDQAQDSVGYDVIVHVDKHARLLPVGTDRVSYSKFALFKLPSVVTVGLTCTDRSPGPYGPGFDSRF